MQLSFTISYATIAELRMLVFVIPVICALIYVLYLQYKQGEFKRLKALFDIIEDKVEEKLKQQEEDKK